ncbi:DUF4407 domain-containing protein [Mycobacterium bohemicum]|uniref:DUF4407 domain-containing protein n=1 Tax=Mycobacterium bohemicum TaxID=56425 RepID=UPI00355863CB
MAWEPGWPGGVSRVIGAHKIRETPSARTVVGAAALGAAFAWLVASAAVTESVRWPVLVVLPLTLLFGLLVGVVTRGVAGIPDRGWRGIAGRAAVAVALGVVVGELAALVVFSRSVDNRLDQRALRDADATPAVAQAAASLQQSRDARAALDAGVERARERQDAALVVARCEYHPTPACPQTRITGIPGAGPETRTADDLLADAQRQLDDALADRDRRAPGLDAAIVSEQQNLSAARAREVGDARRGLGARWSAMNDLTLADVGALTLRLAIIASCALLYLLPLLLALWRRHTLDHHRASASAERERAELDADTAIAVKQAEVRREAEILWAEHRLAQARLAVEAQLEIDREQQRRRVQDALGEAVRASSEREFEPGAQDMYLPIAAEAEAAALAAVRPPAAVEPADARENLPVPAPPPAADEPRAEHPAASIPSLPDATRAAARWIRPLVPPFVARVIDNTTQPLRTARQVLEEVEEITFSFKRTRKITVDCAQSDPQEPHEPAAEPAGPAPRARRIDSSRGRRAPAHPSAEEALEERGAGRPVGPAESARRLELMERDGPRRLSAPEGPRQLPPAE